jgi:hypothetical protein
MGSGYRTFTAGEVLTASNVQNFLQDQVVMVFADSTARATSIGTANFEEGMVSYLQNSDTVEVYNGTTWASIAPTSTSGLTLINTTSFSAVATQSVNDVFSSTYDNYRIVIQLSAFTGGAVTMRMRVSGTDTSSTDYTFVRGSANSDTGVWAVAKDLSTATSFSTILGADATGTVGSSIEIFAPNLAQRTGILFQGQYVEGSSPNRVSLLTGTGLLRLTTQYTGFTFIAASSTMTGTVSVYGYNK